MVQHVLKKYFLDSEQKLLRSNSRIPILNIGKDIHTSDV